LTPSASSAPRSCCRPRRLDGAQQFFTRTFDYGFSKTLTEAQMKWNERDTLGDMVRIIRMFRPLVIYSRFSGTPADGSWTASDGEGASRAGVQSGRRSNAVSGAIDTRTATMAGTEAVPSLGFGGNAAGATIEVQTGVVDPVMGRTYAQIASEDAASTRPS
jgi:hypothetical protein